MIFSAQCQRWILDISAYSTAQECIQKYRKFPTHRSGGDPGTLALPSILRGFRSSSYGTVSAPRAMSWGREGAMLPLVRGEGFLVMATSRESPSSGQPEPGRRAAKRLFIFRYLMCTNKNNGRLNTSRERKQRILYIPPQF